MMETNTEEVKGVETTEEKRIIEVEFSSMPLTRNAMATKNLKPSRRYSSKHVKGNSTRRKKLINRQKRLQNVGWDLLFFN